MSNHPERTCLVCRAKKEKKDLFRIAETEEGYVFDQNQIVQARGTYVCQTQECVKRVAKNKKINISMENLYKMMQQIKKSQKDYLKILSTMAQSKFLTFGINMVSADIKKVHFIIIAEDISDKNDKRIIRLAQEHNIKYVHYGTKEQLGGIFGKNEVNLIGVKSKKVAGGMV